MENNKPPRRHFIKQSAMALGGLAITPVIAGNHQLSGLSSDKKLQILCLGAHPGDPEFGCGGTMARYSAAGNRVTFLYLTRGEASDPRKTFAEMAALRTKEAEAACKALNAIPKFAGQIDGDSILNKEWNDKMATLVLAEKPDILFTQWPLDSHPDHQVTGSLALTAWVRSKRAFELYFYEVNTGVETMAFTPTDYVDITAVHEKKKAAMFAHVTQDPVNTYNNYFKPLEEFRGLEAGVKTAEAFVHFKAEENRATITGL